MIYDGIVIVFMGSMDIMGDGSNLALCTLDEDNFFATTLSVPRRAGPWWALPLVGQTIDFDNSPKRSYVPPVLSVLWKPLVLMVHAWWQVVAMRVRPWSKVPGSSPPGQHFSLIQVSTRWLSSRQRRVAPCPLTEGVWPHSKTLFKK